jgi:hypothetical protein
MPVPSSDATLKGRDASPLASVDRQQRLCPTLKARLAAHEWIISGVDQIGRKQLPHTAPEWVSDPTGQTYFLTLCAKDRSSQPLLHKNTAGRLLEAIRFYNDRANGGHPSR